MGVTKICARECNCPRYQGDFFSGQRTFASYVLVCFGHKTSDHAENAKRGPKCAGTRFLTPRLQLERYTTHKLQAAANTKAPYSLDKPSTQEDNRRRGKRTVTQWLSEQMNAGTNERTNERRDERACKGTLRNDPPQYFHFTNNNMHATKQRTDEPDKVVVDAALSTKSKDSSFEAPVTSALESGVPFNAVTLS